MCLYGCFSLVVAAVLGAAFGMLVTGLLGMPILGGAVLGAMLGDGLLIGWFLLAHIFD